MVDNTNQLRRELRKAGFDTRKDNKGHWNVYSADGVIVRNPNGIPLSFSDTPSDRNGLKRAIVELRAAHVLPNGKGKMGGTRYKGDDPKIEELRESTRLVMETYGLRQTQIYGYGDSYHAQRGLPVPSQPQTIVSRFLNGAGMSEMAYKYLKATIDSIISLDGKLPIAEPSPTTSTAPAPQPEEAQIVEQPVPIKQSDVVVTDVKVPEIAFEALRLFYDDSRTKEEILEIVRRIARLELD